MFDTLLWFSRTTVVFACAAIGGVVQDLSDAIIFCVFLWKQFCLEYLYKNAYSPMFVVSAMQDTQIEAPGTTGPKSWNKQN